MSLDISVVFLTLAYLDMTVVIIMPIPSGLID